MWYIYNGLLLGHKKEQNCVICRDVDRPRDCHTERSISEREKQISYKLLLCGLQKNYTDELTCKAKIGDTDIENKCVDTKVDQHVYYYV